MHRRNFLRAGAAGLALSALGRTAGAFAAAKPPRVGLIGTGWYGKIDLLRLIQVAPVNVVSLCDVDRRMLADAADQVAARQASKQRPRTYADYRQDARGKGPRHRAHRHARPLARPADDRRRGSGGRHLLAEADQHRRGRGPGDARRRAEAWPRRPGRHCSAAARRTSSKPATASSAQGKLGRIGLVEIYCYYHMRAGGNPPDTRPPEYLDYEMWTGPAPLRPYNSIVHPRGWRAFMEYSNGIVGDMCVHMFDAVRWMLDLGWPKRVSSSGGIFVSKGSKANISDTQTATFDYGDLNIVWQHRTWGPPPDPKYPWGMTFYGDKGTLKASVISYDFTPNGPGKSIHRDVTYEREQYPEDVTEKDIEIHVCPAVRRHMQDLLAAIASRGRPVADIEQGYISTASCILANLSMQLGRTLAWDPEQGRIVGDDEANRLLRRPYRGPWVHPA